MWVLYHLAGPQSVLAELRLCLGPDGLVVVCAPSRYNDRERPTLQAPIAPCESGARIDKGPTPGVAAHKFLGT